MPRKGCSWPPALLRRPGLDLDMSSVLTDRTWICWFFGDAGRALRVSAEALQMAERFGADRNVVYALWACGVANTLAQRWEDGDRFIDRARRRIAETGAGTEWNMLTDGFQAVCRAGRGDRETSLALARVGVERAEASGLNNPCIFQGALRARVLRMIGGPEQHDELAAQIARTLELIEHTDGRGWQPTVLLERAGLARLRGDADGMARDLAEARALFAAMGVTGWNDYARSNEA